uniref:beta-ketoacyl-[acyl-carrier-protein] synthase I n=1 Tax=Lygus hesperus TaxID=30085 RepID=A0A0A9W4N0_LYGHE
MAAPHPQGEGAYRCIYDALHNGGEVSADCVGYVNAHATGTIGDAIELQAIIRALRANSQSGNTPLFISSSKGALGHLLGAAGSVEAAIALLALKHQRAPPTANLT